MGRNFIIVVDIGWWYDVIENIFLKWLLMRVFVDKILK